MAGRRKPYLTNSDRLKISDLLDQGESSIDIAKEYDISGASVLRIKRNKDKLRALALSENSRALEKKSFRTANLPNVENALSMWFDQKRKLGEPISGPILVEKALLFNEKLNGPASFKASNGWVEKFKKRHGIKQLSIKGEKLCPNTEDAENFKENFKKYIAENGYTLENVYNADETALNWRSLPASNENEAAGQKINEERVTVMFCANASGTHKIPALVIGEHRKPKCFKNATCLPVVYKTQPSACMNRILFMEWFKESFIPLVTKEQDDANRHDKVLLILDNAPSHPSVEELNAVDEDFTVMYLPPNVTALIQPMEQGVIEAAKRIYKHSFARRILTCDDEIRLEEFINQLNITDCCEMVSTAWGEVSLVSLRNAWNKLLEPEAPLDEDNCDANDISDEVILTTINDIPGFSASASDIAAWIHEEDSEQTSIVLDDDEIAKLVTEIFNDKAMEEMQATEFLFCSVSTTPQIADDGITAEYKCDPNQLLENMSAYSAQTEEDINVYTKKKNAIVVDLRSDTLTQPSKAMRLAMSEAVVGDDVYGEDPTVNELESKAAVMLGKEAALFVPSGTMGNLIAIMVHCNERGCEAYCGEESHMVLHEQGGAAQLAGVTLCPIPTHDDGSFDLRILQSKLRKDRLHEPTSKLVIVENPINGRVVNQEWIDELAKFAKERNLKLHMDGARLWNAVVATKMPVEYIVESFDSITFCLSKGLGAPVGSVLCGSRDFIAQARRTRKVLGGGMRQVGILAAAGIVALDETIPLLHHDHERAHKMAAAINDINSKDLFDIALYGVETNMVFVNIRISSNLDAKTFVNNLCLIEGPEDPNVIVQALALTDKMVRFVFHRDITDEMLNAAISKVTYVLNK